MSVVDRQLAQHERVRLGAAAKGRPDPRGEFGRRKRLDDIVLGTGHERPRDSLVAPVAGDEDHRQVRKPRNRLHQLDAVGPGQNQVEDDQHGLFRLQQLGKLVVLVGDRGMVRIRDELVPAGLDWVAD